MSGLQLFDVAVADGVTRRSQSGVAENITGAAGMFLRTRSGSKSCCTTVGAQPTRFRSAYGRWIIC